MLLSYLLRRLVRRGSLHVIDAAGRTHSFTGEAGPSITIRLHDRALEWKLFFNPRLYLGEAFMDGTLTVENASIYDFLDFAAVNMVLAPKNLLTPLYNGFGRGFRFLQQFNPLGRARQAFSVSA